MQYQSLVIDPAQRNEPQLLSEEKVNSSKYSSAGTPVGQNSGRKISVGLRGASVAALGLQAKGKRAVRDFCGSDVRMSSSPAFHCNDEAAGMKSARSEKRKRTLERAVVRQD